MPRASNNLALWIESSLSENADILLVTIKLNNMIYIMDFKTRNNLVLLILKNTFYKNWLV